jgi:hypothetical protein
LQQLGQVHQPSLGDCGRRHLHAQQLVSRARAGEHVAHWADAADASHQARHLLERATFTDALERAELDDVQPRIGDSPVLIQVDRDLCVSFDAGNRLDRDLSTHR